MGYVACVAGGIVGASSPLPSQTFARANDPAGYAGYGLCVTLYLPLDNRLSLFLNLSAREAWNNNNNILYGRRESI